jgi:hypothetical protein
MKAWPMTIVLLAMALSSKMALAQAVDCDTEFGRHPPPIDPVWSPPVNDLPFGYFHWGTDASIDQYRHWWLLNVIRNGASGPPLVVDWQKGGITMPLGAELPRGQPHCRSEMLALGSELIPTLDQNAPIIYSRINRRQNAAVYAANTQTQNSPGQAATRVEFTYQDVKGDDHHAHVFVSTGEREEPPRQVGVPDPLAGRMMFIYVEKNPELTVGISDLAEAVNADQLSIIRRSFQAQGFTVEVSTLTEFAGADAVKQIFWSGNSAAPNGKVLFLSKGNKAFFLYPNAYQQGVKERSATVFIFDPAKRAIAADTINLLVPQEQ